MNLKILYRIPHFATTLPIFAYLQVSLEISAFNGKITQRYSKKFVSKSIHSKTPHVVTVL